MNKGLKRIIFVSLFGLSVFGLSGCGSTDPDTLVLRIANSEEYIDEGDWDEDDVIELPDEEAIIGTDSMINDFEEWYEKTYGKKIKVEYSTYGTNEELYNQMSLGNTFDLVCPSEYMIMRLMKEGRLAPFSEGFYDKTKEENYYIRGVSPYIKNVFEELKMGDEQVSKYAAGYMWGTMGIVYEPRAVNEEDTLHWDMLIDDKYSNRITMKDGVRDSYFVGLSILNSKEVTSGDFRNDPDYHGKLATVLNDTSAETVDKVEDILFKMRKNAYSLETDSGKADMVTGRVVANMQWSGDAVYTLDQAEEDGIKLCYSVPEECSNLWFDAWVMMENGINKDLNKQHAAEAFVNFISRSDNVIRNMYYIGYTSAISASYDGRIYKYIEDTYGGFDDADAEYDLSYFFAESGEDKSKYVLKIDSEQCDRQLGAQYPTEEVLDRCAVMRPFEDDANKRISQMWINVRCYDPWD